MIFPKTPSSIFTDYCLQFIVSVDVMIGFTLPYGRGLCGLKSGYPA